MPLQDIQVEVNGVPQTIHADIPEGMSHEDIMAQVEEYVAKQPKGGSEGGGRDYANNPVTLKDLPGVLQIPGKMYRGASEAAGGLGTLLTTNPATTLGNELARSAEQAHNAKYSLEHGNYGDAAINTAKAIPVLGAAVEPALKRIKNGEYAEGAGELLFNMLLGKGLSKIPGGVKAVGRGGKLTKAIATNPEVIESYPLIGRTFGVGRKVLARELEKEAAEKASKLPMTPDAVIKAKLGGKSANPMPNQPARSPIASALPPMSPEELAQWEQIQQKITPPPSFPQLSGTRGRYDVGTQERLASPLAPRSSGLSALTPAEKGLWTKIQKNVEKEAREAAEEAEKEAQKPKALRKKS